MSEPMNEDGPRQDVAWFKKVVEICGGALGTPSPQFLEWLRTHGAGEDAIAALSPYVLATEAQIGPILLYPEDGIVGANGKGFVPIAIRDGLLIVGTCPNGDPVAMDVRDRIGEVGYIAHETMWAVASAREAFLPVSDSLGMLAVGVAGGLFAYDYYDESRRQKSEAAADSADKPTD